MIIKLNTYTLLSKTQAGGDLYFNKYLKYKLKYINQFNE